MAASIFRFVTRLPRASLDIFEAALSYEDHSGSARIVGRIQAIIETKDGSVECSLCSELKIVVLRRFSWIHRECASPILRYYTEEMVDVISSLIVNRGTIHAATGSLFNSRNVPLSGSYLVCRVQ